MKIAVLGAAGQLGQCIRKVASELKGIIDDTYEFFTKEEVDITDFDKTDDFLSKHQPDVVINCAAYTDVDGAEENTQLCDLLNCKSVTNLAKRVKFLITFSSDYIASPDENKPLNGQNYRYKIGEGGAMSAYGRSKVWEELYLRDEKNVLIFRTSWLYSEFGKNFLTKVFEKLRKGEELRVVSDQVGCPTYAIDLAEFLVKEVIGKRKYKSLSGVYNYSNNGVASWYDFAHCIGECAKFQNDVITVKPCKTKDLKQKACRPPYSVLDLEETENVFDVSIPYWRDSVKRCVNELKN